MAVALPAYSSKRKNNPFEGKWRWWYSAIADQMLAHPEWNYKEIALALDKNYTTVGMIASTDMFRAYFDARKMEMQEHQDRGLAAKLNKVASLGLDLIADRLDKKRDAVPISQLVALTESALDRLGYAPQSAPAASVQVNVSQNNQTVAVSPAALNEAREALRLAERRRGESAPPMLQHFPVAPDLDLEAAAPSAELEDDVEVSQ